MTYTADERLSGRYFYATKRRDLMPRRNKLRKQPEKHSPTVFDPNYKPGCAGCAFVGAGFKCLTSDGECLKTTPKEGGTDGKDK
jgi:hypothetical protein